MAETIRPGANHKTTLPLSVVINTLNEEHNLPFALRSVQGWAAEIIVCDMMSDDRTTSIAAAFGARVLLHERLGFADPARAFAIGNASHEWVLVLDADEIVPTRLRQVLAAVIAAASCDICWIPRQNYLLGAALPGLGWGPDEDAQMRLFRRSAVEVTAEIHNFFHPRPGARERRLRHAVHGGIVHFNYLDVHQFIEKLNRYTSIEASQAVQKGRRASFWAAVLGSAREWINRYGSRGGYRLGWRGLYLTVLMTMYRFAVQAKIAEIQAGWGSEPARSFYAAEAERHLGPPPPL